MTPPDLIIRQIGDEILHTPTAEACFEKIEMIHHYSSLLKEDEQIEGGVGISCNQCAAIKTPIALFLVGTDDPTTREAARKRYPKEPIPPLTLMINPEILSYSEATYYPEYGEGCLSVHGPIRGKVKRHRSIQLRYQQIDGSSCERECAGFEAHIIQHEYDHLNGIVFLQKIFSDCSATQRQTIDQLIQAELARREGAVDNNDDLKIFDPMMVFDRDEDRVVFESERLAFALTKTPDATLLGMKAKLNRRTLRRSASATRA